MYHTPRVLYDSKTSSYKDYQKLYDQLSHQTISRPVLEFKTKENTDTNEIKTYACTVSPKLTKILRYLPDDNSHITIVLLVNTLFVTKEFGNHKFTYEYFEIMTDMSEKYLNQFLNFFNSNTHTVNECKDELRKHGRNLGYHVKQAIKPRQLNKVYWKQKKNNTWSITLGFLHGTLIKKETDLYVLYINSKDKTILCNKQRKIISEEPIENIKTTVIKLMKHELERYEHRLNTSRYLFESFAKPIEVSPNNIFNNVYHTEDTLPYYQTHIFDSIQRTDDDIFHEYRQHVNDKLQALHERFGKSETFTLIGYGTSIHQTKYETIRERNIDYRVNVTLNCLLPDPNDCNEYDIRYHNDDLVINCIDLHGTSSMTYRIIPNLTEDTEEVEIVFGGLWCGNDPNAIDYLEEHTIPIGPILKAL